jgi:hypothetical protein
LFEPNPTGAAANLEQTRLEARLLSRMKKLMTVMSSLAIVGLGVVCAPGASAATAEVPSAGVHATFTRSATQAADDYLYSFRNQNSQQCAVVRGTALNAPAVQTGCDRSFSDQLWKFLPNPDPSGSGTAYQIWNYNSGQCLVVRGSAPDAPAVQTGCNANYADQLYAIYKNTAGEHYLRNINSNMCLVVRGTAAGSPLLQTPCNPTTYADQQWEFV